MNNMWNVFVVREDDESHIVEDYGYVSEEALDSAIDRANGEHPKGCVTRWEEFQL